MLSELPEEVLVLILGFLPARDLGWVVPLVSHLLRDLAADGTLWKAHFATQFQLSPSVLRHAGDWRHALKRRTTLKHAWMTSSWSLAVGELASMSIPSHCTYRVHGEHGAAIRALDFDDEFVIAGGEDKLIKVWPYNRGPPPGEPPTAPLFELKDHADIVHGLAYRKGVLVSGSDDNTLKMFDRNRAFACVATLCGHEKGVRCLQFYNSTIVSGSYDHSVRVWDAELGKELGILGKAHTSHAGTVFGLQYCPEESAVISVGSDRYIRTFDTRTQQEVDHIDTSAAHTDWHMAVAFDHKRIVVGSRDHTITVWDRYANRGLLRQMYAHSLGVVALQMDDYKIVSGSGDNTARIWPLEGDAPVESCITLGDTTWCLKFSDESLFTGSGRADSFVREFRFGART